MRVKVDNFGKVQFGVFLGLLAPDLEGESPSAVVRADDSGTFLLVIHPSRVSFVTPEDEENYKS